MIIEKVDKNREAFGDYSYDGAILTIGGIEVDLEAEQKDEEVILTFCQCDGQVHRGLMGACCQYVADIIIPPRKYEIVEVECPSGSSIGGDDDEDEEPGTHTESVPVALDVDSVTLKLWPVIVQSENTQEGDFQC